MAYKKFNKKNYTPKNTTQGLSTKIGETIKILDEQIKQSRQVECREFLQTMSKFWHYSFGNQILIASQFPNATRVAGYKTWPRNFNRHVKGGESGIAILQPAPYKKVNNSGEEETKMYFKVAYVYDISQTEGDPLPETPEWKSLERNQELQEKLITFAENKNIKVSVKKLEHDIQGMSNGGEIVLDENAGTKTLIHEIAHELLHKKSLSDRGTRETEAEAVAFVVANHFGIKGLNCPTYIALSDNDPEDTIKKSFDKIAQTAKMIIEAVEGKQDSITE